MNCQCCAKKHHGAGHAPQFRPRRLTYCSCPQHTNFFWEWLPPSPFLTPTYSLLCLDAQLFSGRVVPMKRLKPGDWCSFASPFFSLQDALAKCHYASS